MQIVFGRVCLRVKNHVSSYAYYHDMLALRDIFTWNRKDSSGTLFQVGTGIIEILEEHLPENREPCDTPMSVNKVEVDLQVDQVDTMYETLKDRGLEIPAPPEDKPWGMRQFYILDPDGVRIVFMQPINVR